MNASASAEYMTIEAVRAAWVRSRARSRARSRHASFRSARVILLFALFAAPLAFGAVEPWAWPVLTLLTLAALASWGITCLRQGEARIYGSPLYGLGLLFLALVLIPFLARLTPDRVAARDALILLATDFIIFFLAGQLFAGESPQTYARFGAMVAIYASAVGLFAIFQALSSHGFIYWRVKPRVGAVFGPYVNRNNYAGLMEILIPIAAAYGFTRRAGDWRRLFALLAAIVAASSLLLCGSRGGMAALLAETIIFLFLIFHRKRSIRRRYSLIGGALALIAAVALSVWMNPVYISSRMKSLANFPVAPEVTLGQRLDVTRDTLRIFRDHPWLGTGLGSFMVVFSRYQSFAGNGVWEHAHNDYAEALAETGLIGGLLLLAGLIVFLRAAFGRLDERLYLSSGWLQLGCALGCCGFLLHSFVDFNFHIPANAAWFALALALASAPPIARRPQDRSGDVQIE